MKLFGRPVNVNQDVDADAAYREGVMQLQAGRHSAANKSLRAAAEGGNASALWNLHLLHGSGYLSPYDIDFSAECWYGAAKAGHPRALQHIELLETADEQGLGIATLLRVAAQSLPTDGHMPAILMVLTCRSIIRQIRGRGLPSELIFHELYLASQSDLESVHKFIHRTGVPASYFSSPADEDVFDYGIEDLISMLAQGGYPDTLYVFARCTIVGYLVLNSPFAPRGAPLLSMEHFWEL